MEPSANTAATDTGPTVPAPRPAVDAPVVTPADATDPAVEEAPGGYAPAVDEDPDVQPSPVPSARAGTAPVGDLAEREQAILAFEQRWWRYAGAKEQAIRDTFGISATRYYQLLNALLDNPAALAAEPMLIGRLRRLRASRTRRRR